MNQFGLWIKAGHLIMMVAWFAGLFYLPRLFVYHADTTDQLGRARFEVMERRLYYGIMWPAGIATTGLGLLYLLIYTPYYLTAGWMHAKLFFIVLLWGYHLLCGHYRRRFSLQQIPHSAKFFRFFNEIPTLLLVAIVGLAVVK